jgi:hypothetical protein
MQSSDDPIQGPGATPVNLGSVLAASILALEQIQSQELTTNHGVEPRVTTRSCELELQAVIRRFLSDLNIVWMAFA